jgi:hypothetical protein
MSAVSSLLVAVVAPGSIEACIGRVQEGIFAGHGLASAAALPPLIPVAFLAAPAPRGLLAAAARSVSAPWRVRTTHASWEQDWLFLGVSSGGMWRALRDFVRAAAPAAPASPFPAAEGFFAGCGEATPAQRALLAPSLPQLSFSSASLALIAVSCLAGRDDWWRSVRWEFLETRPLRGRRKT